MNGSAETGETDVPESATAAGRGSILAENRPMVSIVGPAMNEAGNLGEYVDRCLLAFRHEDVVGEIIIIDDGSSDGTAEVLQQLVDAYPTLVRGFRHRRNLGLTQALKTGFANARGDYVLWISTDLESHPDVDIPIFLAGFREGADAVAGYRRDRGDGKALASKIYNFVSNHLFHLALRDMNWTKGFRRECLAALELRGDWHRFILVMIHLAGYRIVEKEMQWHPRRYGVSKFGRMRFLRATIDALSIWFVLTFGGKPMRLFGMLGLLCGAVGVIVQAILVALYMIEGTQIRPLFWSALVLELLAVQFVMFGFLAELVERLQDRIERLPGNPGPATQGEPMLPRDARR